MAKPLHIWRLTDGKPGHMQQTLGLVQALAAVRQCEVSDIDVTTRPVSAADALMGRFLCAQDLPAPHLMVGAGHATHLAVLAARRAYGGRAVVLMKPSLPAIFFDALIVPAHDGMATSARVFNTQGVLNPMQAGVKKNNSVLVLVGGPSKHVQWNDDFIFQQIKKIYESFLQENKNNTSADWCVSDSRRTPEPLRELLNNFFGEKFQAHQTCAHGWLAKKLSTTEAVWVSEDSVSMVYEALTAGACVGLLQMPAADLSSRVLRGAQALITSGAVVPFSQWKSTQKLNAPMPFNESERAAAWLCEKFFG